MKSKNFSLFIVEFKKLGFSAPLRFSLPLSFNSTKWFETVKSSEGTPRPYSYIGLRK